MWCFCVFFLFLQLFLESSLSLSPPAGFVWVCCPIAVALLASWSCFWILKSLRPIIIYFDEICSKLNNYASTGFSPKVRLFGGKSWQIFWSWSSESSSTDVAFWLTLAAARRDGACGQPRELNHSIAAPRPKARFHVGSSWKSGGGSSYQKHQVLGSEEAFGP
jgi:hypothetical protein